MDAKNAIAKILEEKKEIRQIYWVACGGSLIDLYSAHYMMNAESAKVESGWYTGREFLTAPPKKLGTASLVIACSHSGETPETVEAAKFAKQAGAAVITMTHAAKSASDDPEFISFVYPWGDNVPVSNTPAGITLELAAELLSAQENFPKYGELLKGISQMDQIIAGAVKKVNGGLTEEFAEKYGEEPFFYVLGSGPAFSQTYGFAICSLMEMQWQNCAYIHSAEYFHGPFECTDKNVFYFLQKSAGRSRVMDQRAEDFLRNHTDKLIVIDALDLGLGAIDKSVVDYFNPILFYAMNCEFREALAKKHNHPTEMRRYMGIEKY